MNIHVKNITCSTADITIDDQSYQVCYWWGQAREGLVAASTREIVWVTVMHPQGAQAGIAPVTWQQTGPNSFDNSPIGHLIPLFQMLCDMNLWRFIAADHA
jgi:hypothetical protein